MIIVNFDEKRIMSSPYAVMLSWSGHDRGMSEYPCILVNAQTHTHTPTAIDRLH